MRVMGEYERSLVERYQFGLARMKAAPMPAKRRTFGLPVRHEPRRTPIKFTIIEEQPVKSEPPLSWQEIVTQVALKHGVAAHEITGAARQSMVVTRARHEVCYRIREERQLSWAQIGRLLGGRDHTTILHGYRRHKQRMAKQ